MATLFLVRPWTVIISAPAFSSINAYSTDFEISGNILQRDKDDIQNLNKICIIKVKWNDTKTLYNQTVKLILCNKPSQVRVAPKFCIGSHWVDVWYILIKKFLIFIRDKVFFFYIAYLSSLHLAVIGMFISATALDIILKNNKNPLKRKISDADQDPSECPDPATHNHIICVEENSNIQKYC